MKAVHIRMLLPLLFLNLLMRFDVTILASATGNPIKEKLNQSAQYLQLHQYNFLIDCGEGTQQQIIKYGLSYQKIDRIFISHLHADHYTGLIGLINTMNLNHRNRELTIHGPKGIDEIIETQLRISCVELRFKLKFKFTQTRRVAIIYQNNDILVKSIPLKHRLPSTGFLFVEKRHERKIIKEKLKEIQVPIEAFKILKQGQDFKDEQGNLFKYQELTTPPPPARSFAYISDTVYLKNIIPHLRNIDLLFHEATFEETNRERANISGHSTIDDAIKIGTQADVKHLLLGHFSTRYHHKEQSDIPTDQNALKISFVREGLNISISLDTHKIL